MRHRYKNLRGYYSKRRYWSQHWRSRMRLHQFNKWYVPPRE